MPMRRFLPTTLALALTACAPAPATAPAPAAATRAEVPALVGRAAFPGRKLQATTTEVAANATVLLLDATTQATRASTVSAADGGFSLAFPSGFTPVPGTVYVLEAVRGLSGDVTGMSAARLRTLVRFQDGGWQSISNATAGGTLQLDALTTALAIAAAAQGPAAAPPAGLIGSYQLDPGVYAAAPGVPNEDADAIMALAVEALAADQDPVATIFRAPSGTWRRRSAPFVAVPAVDDEPIFPGEPYAFRLVDGPAFGPVEVDYRDWDGWHAASRGTDPTVIEVVLPEYEVDGFAVRALGGVGSGVLPAYAPKLTVDFTAAANQADLAAGLVADADGVRLAPSFEVDGGDGLGDIAPDATTIEEAELELASLTVAADQTLTLRGSHRIRVSGDVAIAGQILVNATGTDAGALTIEAAGSFTLASTGRISSVGNQVGESIPLPDFFGGGVLRLGGAGQPINLSSGGPMRLDGVVRSAGGSLSYGLNGASGGHGGVLTLSAPSFVLGTGHRLETPTGYDYHPTSFPFLPSAGSVSVATPPDAPAPAFETTGVGAVSTFVPYPVGQARVVRSAAIDGGDAAHRRVRWGKVVAPDDDHGDAATVAYAFQDSADGATWDGPAVPAAELPTLHRRYLRVQATLATTDRNWTPWLRGVVIRHQAMAGSD